MQKGSFNQYSEMQNILVSHSINQAQEPLNETGIGRLHVDSKLLVALSQKKKVLPEVASTNERTKYLWQRARTRVGQSQEGSSSAFLKKAGRIPVLALRTHSINQP